MHNSTPPDLPEVARRQLEAANRRDLDTLMSYASPDVVYDTSPSGLGVYEGFEAIAAFLVAYWDAFEELRFEPEELRDLGNGVTLTILRHDARPIGSSAHIEAREAQVTEWSAGLVTRVTVFIDIDEARAAAEQLAKSRS